MGNKRFLDESPGKRPVNVELLGACLASDGSPLVTRKLKPQIWSPQSCLFIQKLFMICLPELRINQRGRGSPCEGKLLSVGETRNEQIITAYLQTE